jgi:predicted ribosomally synthesized peptide with nif11-like leader
MSLENVIAFWSKVQHDKELQKRVQPGAKIPKLSKDVKSSDLEELAKIAASVGFSCTAQELAATEAVIRFWGAVPKDAKLKSELAACEKMDEKKAAAETVRIANAHGYAFTADDLRAVSPAILSAKTGELSDQQLESVAGGVSASSQFLVSSSLSLAMRSGFQTNYRIGPGSVAQYM